MWGFASVLRSIGSDLGFTQLVIFACGALYLLMLVTDPGGVRGGGLLSFLAPSNRSAFLFGSSGRIPVVGLNRWWTVLSAGWLHGSLLHIGFNMMWAYQLVPAVARLYGAGRVVIIYIVASTAGFTVSSLAGYFPIRIFFLQPAGYTLGASAAILGLLGALVYYGRRTGSTAVRSQALGYAVVLIVFGFVMAGVDNWAHLGGFAGGYLAARVLDPLEAERTDHLIVAGALIVACLIAIVVSFVHGLPRVPALEAMGYL